MWVCKKGFAYIGYKHHCAQATFNGKNTGEKIISDPCWGYLHHEVVQRLEYLLSVQF